MVVPGVVGTWSTLLERFGRLQLDQLLAPAIDAAENGVAAGAHCAASWAASCAAFAEWGRPPLPGEVFRLPDLGKTLRHVAEEGPAGFYRGPVAEAVTRASWLGLEDLASFEARWVAPLGHSYGGSTVLELPPTTQGVAVLEALALLEHMEDRSLHARITAVALALGDARRMAVSLIQSLYEHFGSGVLVEGTGIVLNNRAALWRGEHRPARIPSVSHHHSRLATGRWRATGSIRRGRRLLAGPSPCTEGRLRPGMVRCSGLLGARLPGQEGATVKIPENPPSWFIILRKR